MVREVQGLGLKTFFGDQGMSHTKPLHLVFRTFMEILT